MWISSGGAKIAATVLALFCIAHTPALDLLEAVDTGNERKVKDFIKNKADLEKRDKNRRTALMHAALEKQTKMLDLLLDAGADVSTADIDGKTALHFACIDENPDALQRLLAAKANVNAQSLKGETALMIAASFNYERSVQLLLAAGADPKLKASNGRTALMEASWQAAQIDKPEVIRLLLKAGSDVNAADEVGATALMLASVMHQVKIVQLLIDANAEVNARNIEGETALIKVPGNEETQVEASSVIRALVAAGADINAQQNQGETSLMLASKRCSAELVGTLVALKADVNKKDNAGETAADKTCKIVWNVPVSNEIRAILRGETPKKKDTAIGKVFSADGKRLVITGPGIKNLIVGKKISIKTSAGEITATVKEVLHSKVKATAEKTGAAAGDAVLGVK